MAANDNISNLAIFWAKMGRLPAPRYHPLICHLIDVACVTRAMWRGVVVPPARRAIAAALGLDEEAAEGWIVFWAGLHDIGKACPAFQFQVDDPNVRERLARAGLTRLSVPGKAPHGTVSTFALRPLLTEQFGLPAAVASTVATGIGGHHGIFPKASDVNDLKVAATGTPSWDAARRALANVLADVLHLPRQPVPTAIDNAAAMWLSGLVSVADWMGSDDTCFPYAAANSGAIPSLDLAAYLEDSSAAAEKILRDLGWLGWSPPSAPLSFGQLFPTIAAPSPIQVAVMEVGAGLEGPGIVVVEAPMGEGKTEAALFLADHWSATIAQRGCYVALPTQATSNQMFERVRDFLGRRYPADRVNLQLLHGQAMISEQFLALLTRAEAEVIPAAVYGDADHPSVRAEEWFTRRKRGLLAPFGVGTVDQALLAVLATPHVFVRHFGLGYRTVVIDEVHAYDTYMSTLLLCLLEWLGALGSSVVLLSATLPVETRDALMAAYMKGAGYRHAAPEYRPYPRLTWASAAGAGARTVEASPRLSRSVRLEWIADAAPEAVADQPGALVVRLREALSGGGCAAVICNTVARAQSVYRALQPAFSSMADDGLPELDLFHARYPAEERAARERRVLDRFGKPGSAVRRPSRAVLVATQIIEQSLDLDFDLMVTDMAPADLILQRAGRLHRHQRPRPVGLAEPHLWIGLPAENANGVPLFEAGTEAVYDRHTLLRTWLALRDRANVVIPGEVEDLIEAVYHSARSCPDTSAAIQAAWDDSWAALSKEKEGDRAEADKRDLKSPLERDKLWNIVGMAREEDAPDLHPTYQAMTRLAEPSVEVVCLYGTPDEPYLDARRTVRVDTRRKPSLDQIKSLLRRSLSVSNRRIVYALAAREGPRGWQDSALLRRHRLLCFDEKGETMIDSTLVRLDPDLGLVVAPREGGPACPAST